VHLRHREGRGHGQRQGCGASVYYDHPVHAPAEHSLNIDFLNPSEGPSARVAVELTEESARALVTAIQATLDEATAGS